MPAFLLAFNTILPLFLVILAGVLLIRFRVATPDWMDVLNKYALNIGFPALIFLALLRLDVGFSRHAPLLAANSLYLIGCMLLAFPVSALLKTTPKTRQTLILLLPFGNITYLGIPVIVNTLGEEAMGHAILLSAVYLFWMFSLALILIEIAGGGKLHFRTILIKLITNPLLIAVLLGLIASACGMPTQGTLLKALDMIAQSVTAVVLLSLGIFMGSQKPGKIREWIPVFGLSLVVMVLLPGLFFLVLRCTPIDMLSFRTSVLDAAMPSGLTAYALSHQYRLNSTLSGRMVLVSTLFALVLLPLWIVFTA